MERVVIVVALSSARPPDTIGVPGRMDNPQGIYGNLSLSLFDIKVFSPLPPI